MKKGKKVSSSEESDEEEEPKKVVAKVKSPIQKAKSPVQKPLAKPKANKESSSEEEEEEVAPTKKETPKAKVAAKPKPIEDSEEEQEEKKPEIKKVAQKAAIVDEDEEGEFEVCVKGLSFQLFEDDIRAIFEDCGEVTNVKLLMRPDGKSKGLAFVKFAKKSAFNKALELNGSDQNGRSITVEQSQGKGNNDGFKKNFNNGGDFQRGGANNRNKFQGGEGNADIQTPTLFVGGLSYNSTVESMTDYFGQAGAVVRARIVTDRETGNPRGFGYVEYPDVETAKKAYQTLNGGNLDGRQIRLDSASERPKPEGGQGGFGGQRQGGFGGGRGAPRNQGNSYVDLSQDDKFAKKGAIGTFQGKKKTL